MFLCMPILTCEIFQHIIILFYNYLKASFYQFSTYNIIRGDTDVSMSHLAPSAICNEPLAFTERWKYTFK